MSGELRPEQRIAIERATNLSEEDLSDLGKLAIVLTKRAESREIDPELLGDIMSSSSHELFVARNDATRVVGMATMSLVLGPVAGRVAYLEDFATNAEQQGSGIGGKLWDEIVAWSQEQRAATLEFTSNPNREDARAFYERRGAEMRDTGAFRFVVPSVESAA
jgi:ribosomal protein S18 acetylase RimI-like enzyme